MFKGTNKKDVFMIIMSSILFITIGLSARPCSNVSPEIMASSQERCCIAFIGEASGGNLMLCDYLGGKSRYAAVDTTAGETAEEVISRLSDVIEETNPFGWIIVRGGSRETNRRSVTSSGGVLSLPGLCGEYIIAGTETGLGIPQPPYSLTCNYNPDTNTISFRWINSSPNDYDSITISFDRITIQGATLSGKTESYIVDLNEVYSKLKDNEVFNNFIKWGLTSKDSLSNIESNLNIWVYGMRNGIPSNAAVMHLNNNIQEELHGVPFTGGIAPNWRPWVLDNEGGRIHFEEGIREEYTKISTQRYDPVKTPETKPFYQIINSGATGGTGGVFRKFIGLTPGHTYRIKTRVSTLSEPNEKNWSVSFHAAANDPDGQDLSPRQLAGLDALPFPETAIKMGTAHTTGQFAEISTGKTVAGQEIKDITLPSGVDSIIVWVKCSSSETLSAAIDWISLEDLTAKKP